MRRGRESDESDKTSTTSLSVGGTVASDEPRMEQ